MLTFLLMAWSSRAVPAEGKLRWTGTQGRSDGTYVAAGRVQRNFDGCASILVAQKIVLTNPSRLHRKFYGGGITA